jgi:16S rRNA (guanine(527)-N(7))-methyltransferase RsmG
MDIKQSLAQYCTELTPQQNRLFEVYYNELIAWNEKINLTAITAPDEAAIKHFYDSYQMLGILQTQGEIEVPQCSKIIDVGTGAGFPGVPLKIVRPDLQLTLLDSLNKRLIFLNEILLRLELTATTLHSRAEDAGRNPQMREKFDFAVSRAVGNLAVLCEYCLPLVRVGGYFVAYKGADCQEEVAAAANAVKILGGATEKVLKYTIPGGNSRALVVIKKVKSTDKKYPRAGKKLKECPL